MNSNKTANEWQEALINQTDVMSKIVQECLQAALDVAFNKFINAEKYERGEGRNGQRNGSYERELKTRVGSMSLRICRARNGEFDHGIFERYQRSEKALVGTLATMYIAGVSTRKVSKIVEELCGFGVSRSLVSECTKKIDEELSAWRNRLLNQLFMYLIVDARYEKVRQNGHIISKAFVTIIGITQDGAREIIGCYVINSESFEAWDECFKDLIKRGLNNVKYVVSDENAGLRKALQKNFQDVLLQRCQVHFMRNFLNKLSKSERGEGIRLLQDVFAATTKDDAQERLKKLIEHLLGNKRDSVAKWLEENAEDAFVVFDLPAEHRKKMKSTNMVERLNAELKRRSRVVRIFPNEESCLRLLSAICYEISEEWIGRKYLVKA